MKPCETHNLAIPCDAKDSAAMASEFMKKHGVYPLPCKKCGFLVLDPEIYAKMKLLDLKGSIRGKPEEKLLKELEDGKRA